MPHTGRLMGDKMNIKATSKYTLLVNILATLCIIGCSSTPQNMASNNKIELKGVIGWLHGNCFAVRNSNILNGSNLIVVRLDNSQEIVLAKIVRKVSNGDDCYALLEDRRLINLEGGKSFYTVSSEKPIELGIGVIQSDTDSTFTEKEFLDLNGDGRKDTFSQCSTSEGIQFSVWEGVPYKSKLIWSGYYYLGYDTEANCSLLPNE